MSFPFIRNEEGFVTIISGQSYNVRKDHQKYGVLLKAIKNRDSQLFLNNFSQQSVITSYIQSSPILNGRVELRDDVVYYDGRPVHSTLTTRIVEFQREGLPFEPLLKFMEKLYQNPSSKAVNELYDFLENKNLPITLDGDFLAYKGLQLNYYSVTKGTLKLIKGRCDDAGYVYNGIGEEIECARNEVDDDRDNECSYGLHVGGLNYSGPGKFGERTVIVKVNPADVIAVPKDYNAQKARVCHYVVMEDYQAPLPDNLATNDNNDNDAEWYDHYIGTYDENEELNDDIEEDGCDCNEQDERDGRLITPEQIREEDELEFDYRGERRYMLVDSTDARLVYGRLLDSDNKYHYDTTTNYRNFKKSEMKRVYLVNW